MFAAVATTLFFAVTPVFANRSAGWLGSTRANFWRLVVAALVLGLWAHSVGSGLGGAPLSWFIVGGVVGFGIGGLAMFQCLPRLGSNLANLIVQCGSAVAAAGVEWWWLGTRLTAAQGAFVALTLAGIAIGLWSTKRQSETRTLPDLAGPERAGPSSACGRTAARTWALGLFWAFTSAIAQGVGAVISRKAFACGAQLHQHIDPATAAYERALGGLAVAAIALLFVTWRKIEPIRDGRAGIRWVLSNALTGPILGVTCFQWALRTTPAGIVQPIVAAAPLITVPFAAWLEKSHPAPRYYVGIVLAVVGVTGLVLSH